MGLLAGNVFIGKGREGGFPFRSELAVKNGMRGKFLSLSLSLVGQFRTEIIEKTVQAREGSKEFSCGSEEEEESGPMKSSYPMNQRISDKVLSR